MKDLIQDKTVYVILIVISFVVTFVAGRRTSTQKNVYIKDGFKLAIFFIIAGVVIDLLSHYYFLLNI